MMDNKGKNANAFILLGVSPQTSLAGIEEARENAGFDGRASDSELQNAAHALLAPVPRLQEEVLYLWDVPLDDIDEIVKLTQTAPHWQKVCGAIENFSMPALANANMAAMFCERRNVGLLPDIKDALNALIDAQKEIEAETIAEMIHQARRTSGFKPAKVDKALVADALEKLRAKHLEAAFNAIRGHEHPGNLATALVEKWKYKKESGRFVAELISGHYANWVLPVLRPLEEDIDRAAEKLHNNASDERSASIIETKLSEWDEYAQPLQLIDEKKGFDEHSSRKMFGKLRQLVLHLHKEEGATEMSLRITKLLSGVFQELPEAAEIAAEDARALDNILSHQKNRQKWKGVIDIFRKSLEAMGNPGSESAARVKAQSLLKSFKDVLQNSDLASNENIWKDVRSVAISIHNEHHFTALSKWLMDHLIYLAAQHNIPQEFQQRLQEDNLQLSEIIGNNTNATAELAARYRRVQQERKGKPWIVYIVIFMIVILIFFN